MVDATITESPWEDDFPTYELTEDRQEPTESSEAAQAPLYKMVRHVKPSCDQEAAWLKKGKSVMTVTNSM